MEATDGSIVLTRIMMEENIFEPRVANPRISVRGSRSISMVPIVSQRWTGVSRYATPFVLVSIICQVIVGLFANCLSLISDAARQFSDHLEQHKYDRTGTPGQQITEVISIGVACIALAILGVVFIVNASTRAAFLTFEINTSMLLAGTVLAITTNCVQIFVHLQAWKTPQSYSISQWVANHKSQVLHGTINHGLAVTQLIVSTLLFVNPKQYLIADSVGTYILTGLSMANVAAASLGCWREYCGLEHSRADYEEI